MNTDLLIITVDPGLKGGIVSGRLNSPFAELKITPMPTTPAGIFAAIQEAKEGSPELPAELWLEKITGYFSGAKVKNPGDDPERGGLSGKSMLTFGRAIGWVEMAAAGNGLPLREIMPTEWQRRCGIPMGSKSLCTQGQWKKKLQAHSHKLFPLHARKLTLSTCDAALMFYAVKSKLLSHHE